MAERRSRKVRIETLHRVADGRVLAVGEFVVTTHDVYRNRWWWNVPGVVIKKLLDTRVLVEWLGFGKRRERASLIPADHLLIIDDTERRAVLDRMHRHLRIEGDR